MSSSGICLRLELCAYLHSLGVERNYRFRYFIVMSVPNCFSILSWTVDRLASLLHSTAWLNVDRGVLVSSALATSPALLECIALFPKYDSIEALVVSRPFSAVGSSLISVDSLASLLDDDIAHLFFLSFGFDKLLL